MTRPTIAALEPEFAQVVAEGLRRHRGLGRSTYRTMQRKPMWLVEVSIVSGWRAAGR